jgi:carbamoyl-phosphate synthase large subunit
MVNSNPETVSTDYDTSDKLYFEPLTFEDVMNIVDKEKPDGVIVQFGGQTPLNLARKLEKSGAPIIGTSVASIERAENRDEFSQLVKKLQINQPACGSARSEKEAIIIAEKIGFPILVRPSYVLGGRAMKIVYDHNSLKEFMEEAIDVSPEHPVLIDKFLEDAVEVDVDAVSDGKNTIIGGIMEHVEEAGVHSGDSACVLPPYNLDEQLINKIREDTYAISKELGVKGLINIQFAIKDNKIFVLEVNPRASRTIPFVSKATGVPLAKIAAKVMTGITLQEAGLTKEQSIDHIAVKESVLPFSRFSGVDIILSPEMKSTGEVMGIDNSFGKAFYKSQLAAGQLLPKEGLIFISLRDIDKKSMVPIAKQLSKIGFKIIATEGTREVFLSEDIPVDLIGKISEGDQQILNYIKSNKIKLIINTPSGKIGQSDMRPIRSMAVMQGIPCITTVPGAKALLEGMKAINSEKLEVKPLQDYY